MQGIMRPFPVVCGHTVVSDIPHFKQTAGQRKIQYLIAVRSIELFNERRLHRSV